MTAFFVQNSSKFFSFSYPRKVYLEFYCNGYSIILSKKLQTKIHFAHPYFSWERPVNERTNRVLRKFIPKGKSLNGFTPDQVLIFADEINATPTKRLSYRTPEELFEAELDRIYAVA